MSASGQGDSISDITEDAESEISSTTNENGVMKPTLGGIAVTDSTVASTAPDSTEEPEPVNKDTFTADIACSSGEVLKDVDTTVIIEDNISSNTNSETIEDTDVNNPLQESKESLSKAELPNAEKDSSSIAEELRLKWESVDENDEATPTDVVLKMLDREIGIDDVSITACKTDDLVGSVAETDQMVTTSSIEKVESSEKVASIPDVQRNKINENDKPNENDVVKADDSIEESQKIIDEIDNLTQDIEMAVEINSTQNIEKGVTMVNLNKEISIRDMEKETDLVNKIQSEPLLINNVKEMDVDASVDIDKDPPIGDIPSVLIDNTKVDLGNAGKEIEIKVTKVKIADIDASDSPSDKMDTDPTEVSKISVEKNLDKEDDKVKSQTETRSELSAKPNMIEKDTDMIQIDANKTKMVNLPEIDETMDDAENVSLLEDSALDTTITPNVHHRINKPNVMLDIPTQELFDIEAELEDSDTEFNVIIEKTKNNDGKDASKSIPEPEKDITSKSMIVTSPTIEIDATTSKINIKTVTSLKPEHLPSSHLISSSKTTQDNDVKPSTSKDVKDDGPPTLNVKLRIDDEIPSTSTQDDVRPSTSKLIDYEPSTSKIKQEICNVVPSTSRILTPDDDDIQEVTDSLGLLAESSRVMEYDDDETEVEEHDDDEDFDPFEENNSRLEDLEDSITPKMQESDEGTSDPKEEIMDIVDDIECVENELPDMDIAGDIHSNEEIGKNEDDAEIIYADDENDESDKRSSKVQPPEKIFTILEKVLGQTGSKKHPTGQPKGKVLNYVEVEGSSDSDDVLEVSKPNRDVVSVNIPAEVEVMSTSGPLSSSEILSKKGEVVISGVPKPPPHKVSKLNTSEVTIKTAVKSSLSLHIPESIMASIPSKEEIFNLDSDDEEENAKEPTESGENVNEKTPKASDRKCINPQCTNQSRTYFKADRATVAYFSVTKRCGVVCEQCRLSASEKDKALIEGIKDFRPLFELDVEAPSHQLVEISDSDEDEENGDDDCVGDDGAKFLEENLADVLNQTWVKYQMETRLKEAESYLMKELSNIEAGAKEIDAMLNECQRETDGIRVDFYKGFETRRQSLGALVIYDTPFSSYSHSERESDDTATEPTGTRYPKRRAASMAGDTPAKRPAIPMGYTTLEISQEYQEFACDQNRYDDDKDISVVKLSAESAPADLPPCGEVIRPPLKIGMVIYAMRNAFGTWLKGKIMDVQPKIAGVPFTQCKVKFDHKIKNHSKVLAARCLAYTEPSEVRMTIGTRVIALFKDPQNATRRESFYSGVVAEIPNPVNSYRYLVFFDDGYAQYVHHQDTRIVCESSNLVWEEVHPFIRDFICNYLLSYPERPMVRLHKGERLKTEWNGKWWKSEVLQVDASIALIHFDEDNRTEWIYRGSTRLAPLYLELQAAEKAGEGKSRSRMPRSKAQMRSNMPCVEYTRSDGQTSTRQMAESQAQHQHSEELRRQRAVAKKSTTPSAQTLTTGVGKPFDGVISRVVYYTPKNAVKPYKMVTHTCSVKCKRTDLLSLKDLRTYNPLAKPLLLGFERHTVRFKSHRIVMYRGPCGRRLRNQHELHRYLRTTDSELPVDLFDFTPGTHCLAEFVLNKCIVGKKDLSHGQEQLPVPCVNYYDDSLPDFCSYNTERTPTVGVPLNLDPDFLCGCDCTDDCADKTKCACWKMTLEGAKTIGLSGDNVGYVYRRLPVPLPSGIYECNSRCKCKETCFNRVAQYPLQLKLQVFKTVNRGWGIRALNDVPKGTFLCVYAGNLLTDATANLDGLNEGDEYLAELDYIEVVEGMKEGYEDDISEADKKLDKKSSVRSSESESDPTSESEDEREQSKKDNDFQPGYIPHSNVMFKKSLRKRDKAKKKEDKEIVKEETKSRSDCITISDDDEVREPSRFTAQAGMDGRDFISKHSSRVSVRTLFGKDEACYIMDAKVQGNIGRYLNHSCHPNVFVQNVFVDSHDPRFPWVAFFALSHVRAGTELTWNYNYDIGSVPGKCLYCYCGAPNCRGRLL